MDNLSSEHRRKNMQNIKSSGTKPERLFAKELKRRKIYFKANDRSIIGKPDFVFRKKKLVVFVDSCFWHKCPYHYIEPKSNLQYWIPKIKRNKERDREVNKKLKKEGWIVLRFWDHQVKKNLDSCVEKIVAIPKYLV